MEEEVYIVSDEEKDWGEDLYKKWFKAGGTTGFLSLRPWWDAGKLSIDIGEVKEDGVHHTNVWCSIINLGLYLKSVYDGTAPRLYPKNDRGGVPTAEGFVYYGGAMTDNGPVSRILKVHHYPQGESFNENAFIWKTGIFKGRKSNTGAFIPDMSSPLSTNSIKVSRLEMAEIHYRTDLALNAYTAQNADWPAKFNGKKR